MGPFAFLSLADAHGRKKEMGPRRDGGDGGMEEHAFPRQLIP
jgi:hypothetical protein